MDILFLFRYLYKNSIFYINKMLSFFPKNLAFYFFVLPQKIYNLIRVVKVLTHTICNFLKCFILIDY